METIVTRPWTRRVTRKRCRRFRRAVARHNDRQRIDPVGWPSPPGFFCVLAKESGFRFGLHGVHWRAQSTLLVPRFWFECGLLPAG